MRRYSLKQPGNWFTPRYCEVMTAREYHKRFVSPMIPPKLDWTQKPEIYDTKTWDYYCRLMASRKDDLLPPDCLVIATNKQNEEYRVGREARNALKALEVLAANLGGKPTPASGEFFFPNFSVLTERYTTDAITRQVYDFVCRFGPLVDDFGEWLLSQRLYMVDSWDSILSKDIQFSHALYGGGWFDYAVKARMKLDPLDIIEEPYSPPSIPAPLGFYYWAAVHLTSLFQHREGVTDNAFVNQCLGQMYIRSDFNPQRKGIQLEGHLLHYLALSAWYGKSKGEDDIPEGGFEYRPCKNCGEPFQPEDGRYKLCDSCRPGGNAARQKRHRQRHPK